jgi:dTDP-4-dehydrorhamnose 3,5-epimerase
MHIQQTNISDLVILEPRVFNDDRGYFFESFNQAEFQKINKNTNFVQDNESQSSYGVIRGLHCQTGEYAQAKLVRVIQGSVLDVAVDIRQDSPTYGKYVAVELSAANKRQFFIPRGFLHGFAVLSETCIFSYKCDNYYNKESEMSVRYDDPSLGINWQLPEKDIIVSAKDKMAGDFHSVVSYR